MKRLLITGGSGLLGSKIAAVARGKFEVTATCGRNPANPSTGCALVPMDITRKQDVSSVMRKFTPDYVIHAAALTDVDYCEDHRDEARKINAEGTRNVAEACKDAGARMIYVSTDFVFDGRKGLYREEDATNPVNYYGRSKLDGENAATSLDSGCIIARLSVLYGWNVKDRPNFVTWLLKEMKERRKVNIIADQWNSPTYADNCAEILLKLLERGKPGVYHASGSERLSRLEFANRIAAIFGLDQGLIKPVFSRNFRQKALRPRDSSLDVGRIKNELKIATFDADQGLRQMKKQFKFGNK